MEPTSKPGNRGPEHERDDDKDAVSKPDFENPEWTEADFARARPAAEVLPADVLAYDKARRRIAAGEDELIPAEYANRILDGESPVKVYREYRGFSREELAAKARIDVATLGQIESGVQSGSGGMVKIAQVLGVGLDDLG